MNIRQFYRKWKPGIFAVLAWSVFLPFILSFLFSRKVEAQQLPNQAQVEKLQEVAKIKLDNILASIDEDALPDLDDKEFYVGGSRASELKVIRGMIRNLAGMMISEYITADPNALKNSQQFSDLPLRVLRDAHPQGLICLEGQLNVKENLIFSSGLFSDNRSLPVVARFSSSSPSLQGDATKDARGMAVKVKDQEMEHDFVSLSSPVFPTDNASQFADLVKVVRLSGCLDDPKGLLPCIYDTGLPHPISLAKSAFRLISMLLKSEDSSLFEKKYFSVTPFLFSNKNEKLYFKYSFEPASCDFNGDQAPKVLLDKDNQNQYLAQNVRDILDVQNVCFDLVLSQMPDDESSQFAEVHTKTWEDIRPGLKKAKIAQLVFSQGIYEVDRFRCDELRFSPSTLSPNFKSLGSINRARTIIYRTLSDFRLSLNREIDALGS